MNIEEELLPFALELCDLAASISTRHFRQSLPVMQKEDASPVTLADRETEALLRKAIAERYPNHGIIGEEYRQHNSHSEWQWVIDPIDGTKSFISGFPTWATLLSLWHRGVSVLSIIDMPILGERFVATRERPTQLNGEPLHTRECNSLHTARLQSTSPQMFQREQWLRRQRVAEHVALDRFNGDGYLYGMLAAGWIDLVIEADLKTYDYMPLILIVEQAGGIITDWQGRPLSAASNGEILAAATPLLHHAALSILNHPLSDPISRNPL